NASVCSPWRAPTSAPSAHMVATSGHVWFVPYGCLTQADFTIGLGERDREDRFAFSVLSRRPPCTAPPLGTGDRLGFPVNREVRQVIAGLRLIPVILERRTDQVHPISRPTPNKIGGIDVACIHEMGFRQHLVLSQTSVDGGERPLIRG